MTYSKSSTGKISEQQLKNHCKSLGKDNVGVEARSGKYRLNIARAYARMYYSQPEKRISTGLSILDGNNKLDKANADTVGVMVARMHNDLANGHFDKTLVSYGLGEQPQLEAIDGGRNKPQLKTLEVYDMYCEHRQTSKSIAITTLEMSLKRRFRNSISEAIDKVGEDSRDIQKYLLENRTIYTVKDCLRYLDKAYDLAIKNQDKTGIAANPYKGMPEEINTKKKQHEINEEDEDRRAFTLNEMQAIIEEFETNNRRKHYAPIIKFLFWTGCRTGEAIGLQWKDVDWNKELINIRRTYSENLQLFKTTKTGKNRRFPMPRNGKLWNLLKSIPESNPNDVVFKSKTGKVINIELLGKTWRGNRNENYPGVINDLIEQGKVSQYLKLYATRHTFVSIERNVYKTELTTIAQWVGNGAIVSYDRYLDLDRITLPGSAGIPTEDKPSQPDRVSEFLSGLTAEQIEQLKALLNNQ